MRERERDKGRGGGGGILKDASSVVVPRNWIKLGPTTGHEKYREGTNFERKAMNSVLNFLTCIGRTYIIFDGDISFSKVETRNYSPFAVSNICCMNTE